jgi:hypothetical protein
MGITQQIGASSLIKPGVCTSTTRPASPYEGQVIYQTDTDQTLVWNGTAWRILSSAAVTNGSVLQIVAGATNTQTGKSNGTYATSTLTATITPTATTNKILVMFTQTCSTDTASGTLGLKLVQTIGGSDTTIQTWTYALQSTAGGLYGSFAQNTLVSPGSTSAVTFRTDMALTGGSGNVYTQVGSTYSQIILMEIAG